MATALLFFTTVFSQTYDAQFLSLNFGSNKINKIGDGESNGNKVLFTNVITIGGQAIDAIVTTTTVTNASFSDYDNNSADPQFFSPRVTFGSGGGSILFKFQFILSGTYNNSTNSGQNVSIKNFYVNTYDIDGNGSNGTNQFNEFQQFSNYELGSPTDLQVIPNLIQNLTKFRSTVSDNNGTTLSPLSRVRLTYNNPVSSLDIKVGSEGSGLAYFYLDFSTGPVFNTSVTVAGPSLTINSTSITNFTSCAGSNSTTQSFTFSGTNLSTDVVVTAPTGFEISESAGGIYSSSITVPRVSGSVSNKTIFVRMSTTATNGASGNIELRAASAI